jgi:hypothetical protein
MTQAQHTPGPWGEDDRKVILLRGASWLGFAHWDDETAIANARLIAAAPELLAAAKLFVAYDAATDDDHVAMMLNYADALEATRAAIAKAEITND